MCRGMPGGAPVEHDGACRAIAAHRNAHALHATPFVLEDGALSFLLAVHDDPPAAGDQIQRQALGKGLEAAMGSRNASGTEDAKRLLILHGADAARTGALESSIASIRMFVTLWA